MADITDRGEQKNETVARGWNPSRGFWIGMIGVAIFASVLAAVGAYAAADDGQSQVQVPDEPVPTIAISPEPHKTTPPDDFTLNDVADRGVALAPERTSGSNVDAHSSSTVSSPTTVASSWIQSPTFVPPAPAAPLSTAAEALIRETNAESGIRIVTDGQDWGDDDAEQAANIGAVVSAWQRLPLRVTSSVVDHPNGTLQVLSNKQGRTNGGWQPHGDATVSFYTNSDQGVDGYHSSNQIVLATGSGEETVLHEMLHAYAFRGVGADDYVAALLEGEIRSFMKATGWRLLVSDDTLLAYAHRPWDEVNALFAYEGSGLGDAANPLEAFAAAGARFYTSDDSATERAEFAWFETNLT